MGKRKIDRVIEDASQAYVSSNDRRSAVRLLGRLGWYVIGRGCFATVMAHDHYPGLVIRVGAKESNKISHLLDGFVTYARWLVDNKIRSRFAPKIYYLRTAPFEKFSIAVVERCERATDRNFLRKAEATGDMLSGSLYCSAGLPTLDDGPALRFIERMTKIGVLDLHSKNIMQRADGSLVFTDPLIHKI